VAETDLLVKAKGARVLIADDNAVDRALLKAMLNKLGIFEITEATDGKDAEKKIWETVLTALPYRVVILDWMMPVLTGLKLTKMIRADRDFDKVGIFLLTGVNEELQVKEALMSGVDDYILKPVQFDLLKQKLSRFFDK
jgi:CheY-like chemotaxis protein